MRLNDYSIDSIKGLIKNLGSESWIVRQKTAQILADMGEMILPYLTEAMKQPNDDIRYWAIKVMGMIGEPSYRYLEQLVRLENKQIKLAAIRSLGMLNSKKAITLLFSLIPDKEWQVTNTIVNTLAKYEKTIIPFIKELMKKRNEDLRFWLTVLLGRMGEISLPYLSTLSHSSGKNIRFYAAKALGEVKSEKAIPLLLKLVEDKNWSVRQMAMESLKSYGDIIVEGLVHLLERNYNERNFFVVSSILKDLGAEILRKLLLLIKKDIGTIPFVVEKLILSFSKDEIKYKLLELLSENEDLKLKELAIGFVGKFKIEEALDKLFPLLSHPVWKIRKASSDALASIGGKVVIEKLKVCLRERDENMRYWAAKALSKLGDEGITPLISLLANPDKDLKYLAISSLANSPSPRSIIPLIRCLADEDWNVRYSAAETLVKLKSIALPELVKYLNSPDPDIRYWCNRIISQIGDSAVPALVDILTYSKDKEMKLYAAYALAEIGDKRAIPALIEIIKGEINVWIKKYASSALDKLDSLEGMKVLLEALPAEKVEIKRWYVDILSKRAPQLFPEIAKLLNQAKAKDDRETIVYLIELLSYVPKKEAALLLIPLFQYDDKEMTEIITKALHRIGEAAISPLCEALFSDNWAIRKYSADALVGFGQKAVPQVKLLVQKADKNATYWGNYVLRKIKSSLKKGKRN